jgi:hypothetical protein
MAAVLHLLKGGDARLVRTVIDQQVRAGDQVSVVLLAGAGAFEPPSGATVRRLGDGLSYPELLDLIFDSDQVITW